jgi:hypothetical protein
MSSSHAYPSSHSSLAACGSAGTAVTPVWRFADGALVGRGVVQACRMGREESTGSDEAEKRADRVGLGNVAATKSELLCNCSRWEVRKREGTLWLLIGHAHSTTITTGSFIAERISPFAP